MRTFLILFIIYVSTNLILADRKSSKEFVKYILTISWSRWFCSEQFSLFSIVQFPNEECTSASSSTTNGTCYTTSECASRGGAAAGSCAAGFGVCCVISTSTCSSTISTNTSYIRNPGFPSTYTPANSETCTFTISKASDDICQLREDPNGCLFVCLSSSLSLSARIHQVSWLSLFLLFVEAYKYTGSSKRFLPLISNLSALKAFNQIKTRLSNPKLENLIF